LAGIAFHSNEPGSGAGGSAGSVGSAGTFCSAGLAASFLFDWCVAVYGRILFSWMLGQFVQLVLCSQLVLFV
jgi:hypothetical protein